MAVHLADALEEVVPAADRRLGLLRGGDGSVSEEGQSGRPRRARRAPRRARHPPLDGGLKSEQPSAKDTQPAGAVALLDARAIWGGRRATPRETRGEKKTRLESIRARAFQGGATGERAGRMGAPARPPWRRSRWRTCTAAREEGTGERVRTDGGNIGEKTRGRGAVARARARDDPRGRWRERIEAPRSMIARKNATEIGAETRARTPPREVSFAVPHPCTRRKPPTGVDCRAKGRARTSGRKQLNPSSKSGCPPRRLLTRRTTSGVSDLGVRGSAARQRGAVIAPSHGGI